jgi:hypothetical protein
MKKSDRVLPAKLVPHLRRVLNYLGDEEMQDFFSAHELDDEEQGNHIYRSIRPLAEWLGMDHLVRKR